ncbi:MAG: ornithine cyclodeaminase [Muribaculaceae bacterium]|nr:ornithine cyclodeaminase [Muribaculaceae bacterium]
MQVISSEQIESLNISPALSVEWVRESFLMKKRSQLPAKISIHPRGNDFFNTMPCMLPDEYHTYGCKVVSRIKGNRPALKSELMLADTLTGEMTALMNADWITARRTGAVTTLAINTLRKSNAQVYAFVGLGAMAYATLDCLLATNTDRQLTLRFKKYKDHAERAAAHYGPIAGKSVSFEFADTMEELVSGADVVVSCITDADGLLVSDVDLFKPGVLLVPVHTRGFQNCDTVFDRVFADDTAHVSNFKYFDSFKGYAELGDVLAGRDPGRTSDSERILSYNIGLGLHDVLYAHKILELING